MNEWSTPTVEDLGPRHPITDLRQRLRAAGYCPVPINGKIPPLDAWQTKHETTRDEIRLWPSLFPYARSTGILTRNVPTLDIDILIPQAAEDIEALARERFDERGYFLVRFGRRPKRAIPFRTNTPFKKIVRNLLAPDGSEQKIEFLCDGQQVVVAGIHEKTGIAYEWFGGEPGHIKQEDLPYISEAEAQQFAEDAARLLVDDHRFTAPAPKPKKEARPFNGAADWSWLIANIHQGRQLHDSIRDLAAKTVASGMADGAAVNLIRAAMDNCTTRDERWQERYNDIPRAVETAREKYDRQPNDRPLRSVRASRCKIRAIEWLWLHRITKGALNVLAGLPDKGKGLIWSDIVAHVTTGSEWPAGEGYAPIGNVIVFTAEDDIERTVVPRLAAAGADLDRVEIVQMAHNSDGTERMFSLVTDLPALKAKIEEVGDVILVIIDPVSAYLGVGKVSGGSSTDVRGVLSPLTKLAEEKQAAFLAVMHFNKKTDITNAVLRIADSLAYAAAARSVYIAVEDPANENAYLFVKAKCNVAPANVSALRYMIGAARQVGFDEELDRPVEAPCILWDNTPVTITALEAMEAAAGGTRGKAKDEAKDFLQSKLALGPVLADDIYAEAKSQCIAVSTLKRAKRELKIVSDREHGSTKGRWLWRLPNAEEDHRRGV